MAVTSISGSILGIVSLFLSSCLGLYIVVLSFTSQVGDVVPLKLPYDMEGLKSLIADLKSVKDDYWFSVICLFSAAYLFKQTFAIPGSFVLNILAGAIFGSWLGTLIVCLLTATGASCCYLVSKMFGHAIVEAYLKQKILPIKRMVSGDGDTNEFLLLVSLRLFPNTPNWLLNISCPHLGINLLKFFLSVFIGLMPYNFLSVQAGAFLQFNSLSNALDTKTLVCLGLSSLSIISLVMFLKRKRKTKHE